MGSEISTEDDCNFNNTYHLQSAEHARSVGVMFSDFQIISNTVVLPIILALGLVGNGAFLYTVVRVRSMRTATNFHLLNLAVADLVFLTLAISSRLKDYVVYGVPNKAPLLGQIGCILHIFVTYVFHFAGLNLITFISLERYIAVCHPLRHRMISGRSRSVKLIVLCWLVAVILALLVIPSQYEFVQYCLSWANDDPEIQDRFPGIIGRCRSLEGKWANQMLHLTQTIPFLAAFFCNAFFYTRILITLHQRDLTDRRQAIHTRNQVATMLVANGTVFFLTMISFEVASMVLFAEGFTDSILIPYEIRGTFFESNRILVYINSAVNPVVFTLTNARYRRAFRRAFTPNKRRGGQSRTLTASSVATVRDLYQLPSHSPSVNRPATPVENSTPAEGTYFNAGLEYNEETMINN